jgi:intergrase/recombinase
MGHGLGPLQKEIILFFHSKPDHRATRREVYDYLIKKGIINKSQTEKIRRAIRRLIENNQIIIPKTRDLTRTDILVKPKRYRPDLLELNYTKEVKGFLSKSGV